MIMGDAIREICPNAEFSVEDNKYSTIWWSEKNSETKPTEEEVNAKIAEIEKRDAHIILRAREYPLIEEQLDMMWHDKQNDTTTWEDAIAKVKSDNPKASE
tara:strand:- start:1122 stop:1424 length:303 start_codon:yes stop_codon:yes gene_type:complete